MKNICLCFQVHHPLNFQTFRFFDIGTNNSYYNHQIIEHEICEAVENYYLPTNKFLLRMIEKYPEKLKIAFYISGSAIDQFFMYYPEIINSFRQLSESGQVEFMGGTYSHSISSIAGGKEFSIQICKHRKSCEDLFGEKPSVFVNSDLIYNDEIGLQIAEMGYSAAIANSSPQTLGWRSPNYVYSNPAHSDFKLLFRNNQFSEELIRIFDSLNSNDNSINPEQFVALINNLDHHEPIINLYMNYKSLGGFGLKTKQNFAKLLIAQFVEDPAFNFILPSEISEKYGPISDISISTPNGWNTNFSFTNWPNNELQEEAIKQLFKLETKIAKCENTNLQKDWQYLQTIDHFHYMDSMYPVYHNHLGTNNPYKSPYDAFINYMNILNDFRGRLKEYLKSDAKKSQAGLIHNIKIRKRVKSQAGHQA